MKTRMLKRTAAALILCFTILAFSGCYGPFNLTKSVHHWNGSIGSDELNEVVFIAFLIIPVYEFSIVLDALLFNTLEYWTGNNPISGVDSNSNPSYMQLGNNQYQINQQKNRITITQIKGKHPGLSYSFAYHEKQSKWYLESF